MQDGRRVNISTNSLVSEPGQILLIKDVTENRALQENLNRYQRLSAMGEMAASLAHQIRTPLSSALLYTSHLKRPEIPTSERMRCVEKIQLRMRHLESLIKDMLMFARGGCAGEEQIPLSGLLQELEQMASGMNGSYVEIQFVDQAPQAQLRGNREVLLSGLQNLITNAIQSMEQAQQENKKITVLATKAWDDAVDIKVIDNGPGIPEAIQERLLEPFFTTRAQGTGLGLPVVDAIARAHNGCLWFETHSGEGSTFALHLPMTTNEKSVNQSRDRNEHKQKMSKEI